jgi:hypothetical protein
MVTFSFEPWKAGTRIELCSDMFCFELKDKEHHIHVYYREVGNDATVTLDIGLQKKAGYEECVKKMLALEGVGVRLEDNPRLYLFYKNALDLHNSGGFVDLLTSWEDEEIKMDVKVILYKDRVYMLFRAVVGPYRLFYQADKYTKEHDKWLLHFLRNAVGLYKLFKQYVSVPELQNTPASELREKT